MAPIEVPIQNYFSEPQNYKPETVSRTLVEDTLPLPVARKIYGFKELFQEAITLRL